MGKTESLFAGILLMAVALAVLMVVFKDDGSSRPVDPSGGFAGTPSASSGGIVFTGNRDQDICTCYEQAYFYGDSPRSIESIEYKGGFSACTQRLGRDGSNAWTWGWANGQQAPSTPNTCRGYFNSLRGTTR
ncbi:hypothetical protein [Parvularcula sp. LCG005]|uniref:hypothetical protein n=1 Tax=Parvularcula sp. LCG005 TaxID=3078805 RepID=UPI002943C739|nr:hypothetical protein [Parvularcula sp. LCG005]WOI53509.1 hypothetical protein RUI03_00610 [Parvularcula sp. LCG005]